MFAAAAGCDQLVGFFLQSYRFESLQTMFWCPFGSRKERIVVWVCTGLRLWVFIARAEIRCTRTLIMR